mmetsp:Transcript_31579/g.53861  ORF Transcript_31579/g.53861 Transcript_31579/m.53861 type:complete len:475 (-) Transcript_31579:1209-2633(-)
MMQPKQTIIARRRLRRQREIGRGRGGKFLLSTMVKFLALLIGCCFITTLYLMYTLDNQYDGGSENVGKFIRRRQPDRNLLQEVVKKFEHIIYKSASVHDHVDSETRFSLDIKPFFRGEQAAHRGLGSTARASAGDGLAITAVVQISFHPTKLQRLLDLASRWRDGYISVILYVCDEESSSVLEQLESYVKEHASLFEKTVVQIVTDGRPKASRQYPINILRNMGVRNAPTDHVIVLDVDLVPNVGAYADLVKHLSLNTVSREKTALILPSFERSLAKDEDESSPIEAFHIPDTKSDLIPHIVMPENVDDDDDINDGSVAGGKISPFHVGIFPQGHGPTKFEKWITTLNQYQVEYAPRFEPYFVVNKQNGLPPFWEYFQGYGFNKWSWVAELHAAGWKFIVAPNSFLVHIDHDYSTNKSSRNIGDKMAEEFALGFVPYIRKEYGSNPFPWDDLSHSDVIMDTLKELGYDRESWNH